MDENRDVLLCGTLVPLCPEANYPQVFAEKDGVVIVNDHRIDPITVVTGQAEYPEGILETIQSARKTLVVPAVEKAKEIGSPKSFNVIVLGAAAKHMDFPKEDWLKVVESLVPPKTREKNLQAFEIGYQM